MKLTDKVAIITGAGQGIGEATKQAVPEDILNMIVQFMMAIKRPLDPDDLTGTAV